MGKRSLLILLLIILGSITYAQNYLLDNDQNSFHLQTKYSKIAGVNILEVEPGYTINGNLTLSLNYRHTYFDLGHVVNKLYFAGAGIDYLLVRQNKFPLSISVGMNYELGLLEYAEIIKDS